MADLEETAKTLDFVIKRNIPLLPQGISFSLYATGNNDWQRG